MNSGYTVQNSSTGTLTLTVGAMVECAGFYCLGSYNGSNSGIMNPKGLNIDQVKFLAPGSGSYNPINPGIRNIKTVSFSGWNSFMSWVEVIGLVQVRWSGIILLQTLDSLGLIDKSAF